MKLISLLKIILDECTIRLANFEDCCVGDVGTKDDVIAKNDKLTVVRKVMPAEEEKKDRVSSKDNDEEVKSKILFKVGDRVFYPYYGMGTVIANYKADERTFPIEVQWDHSPTNYPVSTFTKDGLAAVPILEDEENLRLMTLEDIPKEETGGSEMGQIAGVINHNIAKKMEEDNEKMDAKSKKFKVGDRVWSPHFDDGIVTDIDDDKDFPIEVQWCGGHTLTVHEYFTKDGKYDLTNTNPDFNIYLVKPEMADVPSKKVDDAINPSHYKVEGLPEAIDIINHLMYREQYEGFLWGNILKYAYRYGRKGDKAETVGKIAWYANQLKDLEEEKHK